MVSDIDLQIAMGIIQLIGVSLPLMLGIVRYYLKDSEVIEDILESHDELEGGATFTDFLMPMGAALFLSYMLACAFIGANTNLIITVSLAGYGFFLTILSFSVVVTLGESVLGLIYEVWKASMWTTGLSFLVGLAMGFLFGFTPYLRLLVFILFIAWITLYFIYRKTKPDEEDKDDSSTEAEMNKGYE